MYQLPQIKSYTQFLRWSVYLSAAIILICLLVLSGWQFDIAFLKRPFPRFVSMNPMTAVLFIVLSVSFLLAGRGNRASLKNTGYLLALFVIVATLAKLAALAGLFDLGVDKILFTDKLNRANYMAQNTAFSFVLAGVSVILVNYHTDAGKMPSQYIALVIMLVGLLSILGYIYDVKTFYGVLSYIPMALHSAICFVLFAIAVFLRYPDQGLMKELTGAYTGSVAAKILVPVAIFVPAILGFIRVYSHHEEIISFEFGIAILVLSIIVVFMIVIWYVTVLLNNKDKLRIIAEKELKASRKQLEKLNEELEGKIRLKTLEIRDTFERVSDIFYALDTEHRFTFVNHKAATLFGKDPEELIGYSVWDLFPKEKISSTFIDAYYRAIETQEYQCVETFSKIIDSSFFIHIYPSAGGVSVFLRDVSEKKKALDLAEKERMLSASIIKSLPGIFYFFDDNGKFLQWNQNFEIMSGYSGEEIRAMTPDQFFADDEKEYIKGRIGKVFMEGISDAEANFLSKDGIKTPFYFTGFRVEFGNKPCLLGVGIDIKKLKETERELRFSEQKYRLLFEWNPMPMWMLSLPDCTFIDVNDAAISHYGYSKEEFLSLNIKDLRPSEEIGPVEEVVKNNFKEDTEIGVWQHTKKNGEIISVEINTHDIVYKDKPVRFVLAHDITEKLKAKKELEQFNKTLRELTSHLQQVREDERKHMAREIHDELGQQLTVIKMDVSWIRKKTDPANTLVLDKIKELMEILDETVNTVRKISSRLRPSLLDDLGLVSAMEWYLNDFKQRTGIEIIFHLPKNEIEMPESIATCLFRILQESITNVARHADAKEVIVSLQENDDGIQLSIKDDGKGYDEENRSGRKTLGILGMKERAAMVGGKYIISGFPGKGTVVSIEIPSRYYLSTQNELI